MVLRWDEQTLAAIRALKTGPTINARALAIVHTAMYDAWAAYDATAVGTRLGGSLRRPAAERTLAHKRMAVSFAAYRARLNLFPAHWRNVTPFALTSPDQLLPPGPTRLTLGLLDEEVNEAVLQSAALTDLQKRPGGVPTCRLNWRLRWA